MEPIIWAATIAGAVSMIGNAATVIVARYGRDNQREQITVSAQVESPDSTQKPNASGTSVVRPRATNAVSSMVGSSELFAVLRLSGAAIPDSIRTMSTSVC